MKLDAGQKESYKALIANVRDNPNFGAAGGYADQALNLALGNTTKEKGIKIANIKDEADRMAVVAVLENIMIASAQPQATSDVSSKVETTVATVAPSKVETPATPATPAKPAEAKSEGGA